LASGLAEVPPPIRVVPDREEAKSLEIAGELYQWLAELEVGRHDTIVGVGGGALTDIAGFVAATWLRGIESVLVPTTLVGAVDAAIGGKTGINVLGKNLVGAFWSPSRVIVNLDVLERIPAELRREGMAEALKAGLIGDAELVAVLERHGFEAPLETVVTRAVAVKAEVVTEDFREGGRRAVLNFGHTIGHAVERITGMPHGHAVAVGMVAASAVSARRYGFPHEWLTSLIFAMGLPVAVAGSSSHALRALIGLDKKRTEEGIRMVLLRGIADPVVEPVSWEEIDVGLVAIGCV
jgi:3-dehydroquinate synthetase